MKEKDRAISKEFVASLLEPATSQTALPTAQRNIRTFEH